jgi:hypothetical protein
VSGNGWANTATIDIIYDVLHMMGHDDIIVGLGSITALGTPTLGCKYVKAIPNGSGGLLDSDTLFGLGRTLPRSPRRLCKELVVHFPVFSPNYVHDVVANFVPSQIPK